MQTALDRKPLAAGCDQQGRFQTRMHRVVQWPDTIPVMGSADCIGDDQAERSGFGGLDECATEGGEHHDPVSTQREPGLLGWLLWPLGVVAAIAAAAALIRG